MIRIAGMHDTLDSFTCLLFFITLVECDEMMLTLEFFFILYFFFLVIEFYLKYIGFHESSIVPCLSVEGS